MFQDRTKAFQEFSQTDNGVLFCTVSKEGTYIAIFIIDINKVMDSQKTFYKLIYFHFIEIKLIHNFYKTAPNKIINTKL